MNCIVRCKSPGAAGVPGPATRCLCVEHMAWCLLLVPCALLSMICLSRLVN